MSCEDCRHYATCSLTKMQFEVNCAVFELKEDIGCEVA